MDSEILMVLTELLYNKNEISIGKTKDDSTYMVGGELIRKEIFDVIIACGLINKELYTKVEDGDTTFYNFKLTPNAKKLLTAGTEITIKLSESSGYETGKTMGYNMGIFCCGNIRSVTIHIVVNLDSDKTIHIPLTSQCFEECIKEENGLS